MINGAFVAPFFVFYAQNDSKTYVISELNSEIA